jgi:hypothetical protein
MGKSWHGRENTSIFYLRINSYLNACRVLIKDFGQLVEKTTLAIKAKANELAQKANRPLVFVSSSQTSKEASLRGDRQRQHYHHRASGRPQG